MLAMLAGVGVVIAQTELPEIDANIQASYICAGDVAAGECTAENAMTRLQTDDGNRTNVPLDEVPDVVVEAVLATEDRNFYEHDGINPAGIARAMFQNVKSGSVQQGGSTITQQYVLNALGLEREGGIERKLKEAVLSIKLEQEMSKDEILEGYLNEIYFGRGSYGVGAASRAYFGIDVRAITDPGQAALLAGLIRAPNLAEPSTHAEEATRRRHTGLVAMQQEGYLTADEVTLADAIPVAAPWVVAPPSSNAHEETLRYTSDEEYVGLDYLPSYVRNELQRIDPDRFTSEFVETAGLRIYTSLDYNMQRAAWDAVTTTLPNNDDPATPEWEGDPDSSMVAVDDQGLIRAMVGSRHKYTPGEDGEHQTNLAYRHRGSAGFQPGSTFKPIVLAEALREGYSVKSRFNAQGTIEFDESQTGGDAWKVSNYSESDAGVMDMVEATAQSSNTAYAQLMLQLGTETTDLDEDGEMAIEGPDKVAEFAESMGFGGDEGIAERQRFPPMVLGTAEATPVEMAGVYSTFANRGMYRQPSMVTRVEQVSDSGAVTVLYQRQMHEERVMAEGVADIVTHTLQGVIDGGTGANADIGKPAAGKTGTAQQNRASWFAGYVPKLTAVVWMGYPVPGYTGDDKPETPEVEKTIWPMNDDGRPVQGRSATGGSFPAEIWRTFMVAATGDSADEFVEVTPEALAGGDVINQDELLTPEEAATTTTMPGPGGPGWSIPDITLPGRPGRPGNDTTTTSDPSTTDTSDPGTTDTSDTTISTVIPGIDSG